MSTGHMAAEILNDSVYGLPELFRKEIKDAPVIGNPGCFAMAMILALLPLSESGEISAGTIICDGKTGVSGAGINPGKANSYPLRYEAANSYKEGKHQHLVEVENILKHTGSRENNVFFVPQIIPMNRGIIVTSYLDIKSPLNDKALLEMYNEYYRESPFVIISENSPSTAEVRGTNRCVIKPLRDNRTGKLLIVSVIDNLLKGQSGNAVQNANIRLGFEETAGLNITAIYP
jgi:N-acetyl-gamma-glutamyl-phosphate reductase